MFIPGGYVHVVHELVLEGDTEPMAVTYGLEINALTPEAVNAVHDVFGETVMPTVGEDYSLIRTSWYTETVILESTGAVYPGGDNPASLPQNCAVLVTKRSGFRGRKNTGRMFIPGISEGNVSPTGIISPSQLTVLQTAYTELYEELQLTGEVDDVVILHGTEALGAPTPVVAFEVSDRIATQRRRLR